MFKPPARQRQQFLPPRATLLLAILTAAFTPLFADASEDFSGVSLTHCVTNVAQFRSLSGEDYLAGCAFRLSGVVTLVDTNRELIVLQDATGAVGLRCPTKGLALQVGESVSVSASNCAPLFEKFPDYPHRPARWEIRERFEAPSNWGDYHLTRMRGFLHPPVSGRYTFWIASDNSSELWLSPDTDPSKKRKIASVARFDWTSPREWSKFPSQRSEAIGLNAGQSYYIEALQEQTGDADHLAVAWQGPETTQSVIPAGYLTPWDRGRYAGAFPVTNGILSEYWTNFSRGDLSGLGGARPFESALSVEALQVSARAAGRMPTPSRLSAERKWTAKENYCWMEVEGRVLFVSEQGENMFLGLAEDQLQVRTVRGNPALERITRAARAGLPVRIAGVCEGTHDEAGNLVPGLIWLTTADGFSVLKAAPTNAAAATDPSLKLAPVPTKPAMVGFYSTRAVVTFYDRVFGKDCLFVQERDAAMLVSLENFHYPDRLNVGEQIELGGALQPGKFLPLLTPLVMSHVGWSSMPVPLTEPIQSPIPGNRDGRWTEIEGVVHAVDAKGTLELMGRQEAIAVWLGNTGSSELSRYVDAKLRVRGVLSLSLLDYPVLLVPSRSFVEVEEAAPKNPFEVATRSIEDLKRETTELCLLHRTKVAGEVTWRDGAWFFVQDQTGGIQVQTHDPPAVKIGDAVEVAGFSTARGAMRILADAVVRKTTGIHRAQPANLELSQSLHDPQNGNLVRMQASLLGAQTVGNSQILELQNGRRVFTATLGRDRGRLTEVAPGSEIEITGVCDTESAALPIGTTAKEKAAFASLNVWLRSPADVRVLQGPAWWTWKRAALLIGTLFTVSATALFWVHFLQRRLERQKAAQLAFSQQVLKTLEDERHRIAANLHDSLGQVLLAIRNQSLIAMQRSPEDKGLRQRLDEISNASSQALDEVRQITHGLRPYQLDRLGLAQAIRATVTSVASNSQILFASRVEEIDNLFDKDSEIHVYRIVQEAINNVIKHSRATEAAVVIKNRTSTVSLSVRDNGQGFDLASVRACEPHALGFGLSGIAERVRILSGTLAIDSRPGAGTSLSIEIPVTAQKL